MDPAGACCNCLVADGCTIEGTVENSILFRPVPSRRKKVTSQSEATLLVHTAVMSAPEARWAW